MTEGIDMEVKEDDPETTKAMERRIIKNFPQENPENTIHHQKTCLTDLVIYTQRSSMVSVYPGMQ
jgi:hypothetical protein